MMTAQDPGQRTAASAACKATPGTVIPVVNPNRCEAKADCVAVCPYDVFELRALTPDELASLPFLSRIRVRVHGGRQAFAVRADDCHACGHCVSACPERAISLQTVGRGT
jgi:NAD-dependent dihydropyrimidine dehydrogenase PreA subunit